MPDWCDNGPSEHYYDNLEVVHDDVMYALLASGVIVSVIATYLIFCTRNRNERPLFVTLQVILLNFFWILFIVYVFLEKHYGDDKTRLTNFFVSVADLCLSLHDWILTEKFL